MKNGVLIMIITSVILAGCSQIQGSTIFNFFNYKDTLNYATNCSLNTNISLDVSYCNGTMKRPIFYNYFSENDTWNSICCTFDSRCLAKTNANASLICSNLDANFTYIGPVYGSGGAGSMCCNGEGICLVDYYGSNCTTTINSTASVATITFNLSGTTEWDAMCCISGGY